MAANDGFWYIWVILFALLIGMSIWRCQRRNAMMNAAAQEMVVLPAQPYDHAGNPPPGFVPMFVNGTLVYVPQYSAFEQPYPAFQQPGSPQPVVAAVPIQYAQPVNQPVSPAIGVQPYTGQTYHLDDAPPAKGEPGTYAMPPQQSPQPMMAQPVQSPQSHTPPPSYNPARRGEL